MSIRYPAERMMEIGKGNNERSKGWGRRQGLGGWPDLWSKIKIPFNISVSECLGKFSMGKWNH
jgi:hypothetical protein